MKQQNMDEIDKTTTEDSVETKKLHRQLYHQKMK